VSGQKKQLFLYAGIGFVAIGIASAVFIYLFVFQPSSNQTNKFTLEEVHADPKLVMHDHVSLAITANGEQIVVPQEIGIKPELWKDHSLDKYGPAGLSPMHTHDTSGVIHIESTAVREYTFGEFLQVWGIDTSKIASVIVDGNEVSDYKDHVMKRGEKLQMEMTE
jgi:hypothetical protein